MSCKCEERQKPVADRAWFIMQYRCNHSSFNGGRRTPSDYSEICCHMCRCVWRTKASFVEILRQKGKKL